MPQSREPFREDVEQPAANELMRCQGHDRGPAGTTASPQQADAALLVITEETFRGKRTAVDVTGQIAQRGDAFADMLELHVPLLLRLKDTGLCRGKGREDLRVMLLQGGPNPASEPRRERLVVDQKSGLVRVGENLCFGIKRQRRNDAMNMGVVLHLAAPGMEDGGEPATSSLVFGGDDIGEGPGAFAEDEIVDRLREREAKRAQLCRQREGHHEVGNREETGLLFCGPELLIESAALWAVAVVATVVGEVVFLAIPALVELTAEFRGSAREDAAHRFVMSGAQRGAMVTGVARPMLRQNIGERYGHGEPGKVAVSGRGEGAQGNPGFFLTDLGEMEINHDRFERAVSEVGGDLPDRGTAFEHVRGIAVTERVNAEDLVFFVETTLGLGEIECRPDSRLAHWFGMGSESLPE